MHQRFSKRAAVTVAVVALGLAAYILLNYSPAPLVSPTRAPIQSQLDSGLHQVALHLWEEDVQFLLIDLPLGYDARRRQGADFIVFYATQNTGNNSGRLGIYLGHNPSTNWPEDSVRTEDKSNSGTPITWHDWAESLDSHLVFHREALIEGFFVPRRRVQQSPRWELGSAPPTITAPPPPPQPPEFWERMDIHIFIDGEKQEDVDRLTASARTLRKAQGKRRGQ